MIYLPVRLLYFSEGRRKGSLSTSKTNLWSWRGDWRMSQISVTGSVTTTDSMLLLFFCLTSVNYSDISFSRITFMQASFRAEKRECRVEETSLSEEGMIFSVFSIKCLWALVKTVFWLWLIKYAIAVTILILDFPLFHRHHLDNFKQMGISLKYLSHLRNIFSICCHYLISSKRWLTTDLFPLAVPKGCLSQWLLPPQVKMNVDGLWSEAFQRS
jgi:hypothetical protein